MRSKGVLTQCIFSRSGYRDSPTDDVDADYAETWSFHNRDNIKYSSHGFPERKSRVAHD